VRRAIAGIGRGLVTLGLLILLFVAYQLWGTGYFTAQAQNRLDKNFKRQEQQYENDTVATTPVTGRHTSSTTVNPAKLTRAAPPIPAEGQEEGRIEIPKIGLSMLFVEGTDVPDLQKGPGHYPDTPMPGTIGNAAIAGHRTTYLHPFYRINELNPGDKIIITYPDHSKFTYEMYQQLIVKPTEVSVVDNTPDPQLTLTSCNPRYSAAQRIVIKAKLVPNESAKPTKPRPPTRATASGQGRGTLMGEGLSTEGKSHGPAVGWGIIAAVVGLAWWWAFRRWRHPGTWLVGLIPFLIVLFPFYVYLERALPQGIYSG
jgi:sortase A